MVVPLAPLDVTTSGYDWTVPTGNNHWKYDVEEIFRVVPTCVTVQLTGIQYQSTLGSPLMVSGTGFPD